MHRYHVNEFVVDSEIVLPASRLEENSPSTPTYTDPLHNAITIRRGSLAHIPSLLRKLRRQLAYDVGDGILIEPKSDLAFHIDLRGQNVIVDCADTRLTTAAAWCFHAALGAATLLRGGLPIHGAGLEIEGRYIALCAPSGSGKSTLSWFLLEQGARFANDDLVPTYVEPNSGSANTFPSMTLMPKLQRETVDHYKLSLSDLLPADYGTNEEEYHIPLPETQRRIKPGNLNILFSLRPDFTEGPRHPTEPSVTVRRMTHDEAVTFVGTNLHADWIIGQYLNRNKIRERCVRLADRVPIYELSYRRSLSILPALHKTIVELAHTGAESS